MKDGLLQVLSLVLSARATRAVIVPWSISKTDVGHITSTSIDSLHMGHQSIVDHGAIGVQDTLFHSVDDDTSGRRGDLDVGVGDTVLGEGQIDVSSLGVVRVGIILRNGDLSEEAVSGVRKPDEQQSQGCCDRCVDAIFDGREDGDQDCSSPDDEFEGGDSPEGIDLYTHPLEMPTIKMNHVPTCEGEATRSATAWMMIADRPAVGIQKKASVRP